MESRIPLKSEFRIHFLKIHFLKIHFKSYNGFHAHLYNPVMLKRRLQTVLTAPISPKNFDCYSSLLLLNEHHCLHKLHLQSSWCVRLISTCTKNLSLRFCFVMWCPIIGKSSNVIMSKEKAFTAKRKSKKKNLHSLHGLHGLHGPHGLRSAFYLDRCNHCAVQLLTWSIIFQFSRKKNLSLNLL